MLPSNEVVEIVFEAKLFSADAIQKAAFRVSESFAAEISLCESIFLVRLRPTGSVTGPPGGSVADEFRRCVLDEMLREKVFRETAPIRQLLLETAFSRAAPKKTQTIEP